MKKHSTTLFAGAFVSSLLLAPVFVEAEVFGYTGIKGGYSHLFQAEAPRTDFKATPPLPSSSASSFAFGVNVGLGYLFTSDIGVRFEAEYLYRARTNFKERSLSPSKMNLEAQIQSLLGNAYLDYYLTPSINLYLSAGIGANFRDYALYWTDSNGAKTKNLSSKNDKTGFAWQMGLGVGYAITENLGLDFNLRYVDFGKAVYENISLFTGTGPTYFPLSSMDALLGFNYRF